MENAVGVIGGVGPMATAYFLERVIAMTQADRDQDHINMVIYNHATIPDRTAYILDENKEDPLGPLIADAQSLEKNGCNFIVIPCNTAHYFYESIEKSVHIPVVNIVEETIRYAVERVNNLTCLGIMATDGTLTTETYQKAAKRFHLKTVQPNEDMQKKVMAMIYDGVKAGKEVSYDSFAEVADYLRDLGAQCIILGCTELSVLKHMLDLNEADVLDSIDVLATETVRRSGKVLTKEAIT